MYIKKLLILAAFLLVGGAVFLHTARAADESGFSVCATMTGSPAEFEEFQKRLGPFNCVKRYVNLSGWVLEDIPSAYVLDVMRQLDFGLSVKLVVTVNGYTLADINAGKLDDHYRALARAAAADGREVVFVPLHEFNGGTYSWSMREAGSAPADFVRAWRRIVNIVRAEAPNVLFDLNYNRVSKYRKGDDTPESRVADFEEFFPGEDYVDIVSISGFNRFGLTKWHDKWLSFGEVFKVAYEKLASFVPTHIPIEIAETGTVAHPKDSWAKERWYLNFGHDVAKGRFPRLKGITLFLEVKTFGDKVAHWKPETESQWRALAQALAFIRQEHRGYRHCRQSVLKHRSGPASSADPDLSYPWTIRGSLAAYDERANTALNPVTGEEFGGKETLGTFFASQGVRVPLGNNTFAQASLYAGMRVSTNSNRWWDNSVTGGIRLEWCRRRPDFAAWGRLCLYIDAAEKRYSVPVPPRLEGMVPTLSTGFFVNIGGSDRWW